MPALLDDLKEQATIPTVPAGLYLGPSEERIGNLSETGEVWRNQFPPNIRILFFASLLQVFTLGQVTRYLFNGAVEKAESELQDLLKTGALQTITVRLLADCGGGCVAAYYLTSKGARLVNQSSPALRFHAKPGRPRGRRFETLIHDLYVTEAYITIVHKCIVLEFHSELELRRSKLRARHGRSNGDDLFDEHVGDFSVLVVGNKPRCEIKRVECEIALRLNAEQVLSKPPHVLWFVHSQSKANVITNLTKRPVRVLGDIRLARGPNAAADLEGSPTVQQSDLISGLSRPERSIVNVLEIMGGAGTSDAIAQTLAVHRSGVSHQLCKLEQDGVLQKVDVSLVPGRDRKRPHRLFAFADLDLRNFDAQLNYLAASLVISKMSQLNHSLNVYDPKTGILEMKDHEDSSTIDLLMIDDHRMLVRQLFQRIREVSSHGSPIVVAMCDDSRMAQLKVLDPAVKIADLRTPL